jgi:hypothetical protein
MSTTYSCYTLHITYTITAILQLTNKYFGVRFNLMTLTVTLVRLGPSRSLLGALLEGTAGRMQCVLFRLANQNTSTANRGAK